MKARNICRSSSGCRKKFKKSSIALRHLRGATGRVFVAPGRRTDSNGQHVGKLVARLLEMKGFGPFAAEFNPAGLFGNVLRRRSVAKENMGEHAS